MISAPNRRQTVELIDQACASGAAREKACQEMGISLRTYQRWTRDGSVKADGRSTARRAAPANQLTRAEREAILEVCNRKEYQSLPPSQIVPRLADQGEYLASESSFYRVLRQNGQVQRRGKAQAPRHVPKPREYQATAPNQVWSRDITYLAAAIAGVFFRLYLVMDIYSRKIVGREIHESENAAHASVLIQKACLAEGIRGKELVLHADNGSPMKGATLLATLQKLGVVPSFSRPSVSDDNPYSESLFRTLKYAPAYPSKPFESIEAARQWVHRFVQWYNQEHRHSAIRFVTPAQRHRGEEHAILAKRKAVYANAKTRHPERWTGEIRNWEPVQEVWLNPQKAVSTDSAFGKRAA